MSRDIAGRFAAATALLLRYSPTYTGQTVRSLQSLSGCPGAEPSSRPLLGIPHPSRTIRLFPCPQERRTRYLYGAELSDHCWPRRP